MPHRHDRLLARCALVAALAAALALAACGRKGPLDPPPGAAAAVTEPGVAPAAAAGEVTYGPDGQPIAPRGPRKRIFLDWLLD